MDQDSSPQTWQLRGIDSFSTPPANGDDYNCMLGEALCLCNRQGLSDAMPDWSARGAVPQGGSQLACLGGYCPRQCRAVCSVYVRERAMGGDWVSVGCSSENWPLLYQRWVVDVVSAALLSWPESILLALQEGGVMVPDAMLLLMFRSLSPPAAYLGVVTSSGR